MSTVDAKCPNCGAEYKLTPEQLSVAQGQVRCGACMTIFQAIPDAQAPLDVQPTPQSLDDEGGLVSDDELISDGDDDILIKDETREFEAISDDLQNLGIDKSGEGNFFEDTESVDVVEQEEDLQHVDESWAEDLMDEADELPDPPKDDASNIDEFADAVKLKQPVSYDEVDLGDDDKAGLLGRITPEPLELKVHRDHSAIINLFFSLALVFLVIGLVFQLMYFTVDTVGRKPEWRSTYASFCKMASCTLPEQYDVREISAGSTHQKSHNLYEGALIFETVITNHAKFRQPFPNIDIFFKNMDDKVIAARSVKPSEYLRGAIATSKTMPIRQPIHLAIEINDPGVKATGYEVKLSYPN